jgi:biopolymer transport protein ExbD
VSHDQKAEARPFINVTPLIDVLLVLLIIFMVAAPLKPHDFKVNLPSQLTPELRDLVADPRALVVTIQPDMTLKLNGLTDYMGTVDDTSKLSDTLSALFKERKNNHVYRDEMLTRFDLPEDARVQKTVFVKAPRSMPYFNVTMVIDGLKGAGADPVGLQLDELN